MRVNLLINPFYRTYYNTTLVIFVIHMIPKHETLHSFGIGSPSCLKLNLYVRITP
jgi:hypothetical protein